MDHRHNISDHFVHTNTERNEPRNLASILQLRFHECLAVPTNEGQDGRDVRTRGRAKVARTRDELAGKNVTVR